ncbi:MAG: ABC transporter ATP-binding protein/permease [Gammaproteobacteria bacterium]|nr:ABC transporter ATP-binding protein/permease [Gammaproteobacteria bacterium]NNJ51100.1 ABC transporter ATP-binding protein [Gammaproteobacteria bacterium]
MSQDLVKSTQTYTWQSIFAIVKQHKPTLVLANIIAILAAAISVPVPLLMPLLVDEVLLDKPGKIIELLSGIFPAPWLTPISIIVIVMLLSMLLRLVALLLAVWQTREFTSVAKDVTYRIRLGLLNHLQKVSMAEYEAVGSGSITSHLVTDVTAIDDFLGATLSKFIVAVLTVIGVAGVLLWMHWQLALFILLMNPVVIYFTMVMGKKVKHLKRNENVSFELFQQALIETLDGIQQIRASNREGHYLQRVISRAEQLKKNMVAFGWKSDAANRLSFFIFLMGFEVFRGLSMVVVLFSGLSIGEMFAVYAYLWFMMGPMQEILGIQYSYYSANAAIERINNLLTMKLEPEYEHRKNPFAGKHTVGLSVENVSFRYGDGLPVLDGVSLSIAEGEKVALVGASGGGKSTLVQIILGLYPADEGQLYFDGVNLEDIGLEVVRENVSTVLQHPAMFNDTVKQNLCLGREIDDAVIWQALEIAQMRDIVEQMPEQLESVIGRSGIRLSGGQRQRLAIARMILADPKVVILDEATSSLDTETEARLHEAMHAFLQNRTTLIIAHRLSAVRQADRVLVFDSGKIIDEGNHHELISRDGLYRDLYGIRS